MNEASTSIPIQYLPDHHWGCIFQQFSTLEELSTFGSVCSQWRKVVRTNWACKDAFRKILGRRGHKILSSSPKPYPEGFFHSLILTHLLEKELSHWPANVDKVQKLVNWGAKVSNRTFYYQCNPWSWITPQIDLISVLWHAGVNVDGDRCNTLFGGGILHSTTLRLNVVKFLLEHGANPNLPNDDGNRPLHCWAAKALVWNGPDKWINDIKVIRTLIAFGADTRARNKENRTPLEELRYQSSDLGCAIQTVEYLLKTKADTSSDSESDISAYWTP